MTDHWAEHFEKQFAYSPPTHHGQLCPMPNEVHPYYADKPWLVDWLNDVGPLAGRWDVSVPVWPKVTAVLDPEPVLAADFREVRLSKQRYYGLAPYVGRRFVYTWKATVDELGRAVAGDARIEYVDR